MSEGPRIEEVFVTLDNNRHDYGNLCYFDDHLAVLGDVGGALLLPSNQLDVSTIQGQRFYCEKYQTAGRWVCSNNSVSTLFYYNGEQYTVPFKAVFTPVMLPCLIEAALLQMEAKIEEIIFRADGFESW